MEGLIDCVYGWMEKRICESTSKQTAVSERVEKGKNTEGDSMGMECQPTQTECNSS
jgi:hypothetical protein